MTLTEPADHTEQKPAAPAASDRVDSVFALAPLPEADMRKETDN